MLQKYKKSRRIILCNLIFRPKDLPYLCNTLFLFCPAFHSLHTNEQRETDLERIVRPHDGTIIS